MSKLFSIRLSDEAASKLELQSNKSSYVNDLILGKVESKVPWLNLEARVDEVKELILSSRQTPPEPKNDKPDEFAGSVEATGDLACCRNKRVRCKHWQYDINLGEWNNTLTGEKQTPDGF